MKNYIEIVQEINDNQAKINEASRHYKQALNDLSEFYSCVDRTNGIPPVNADKFLSLMEVLQVQFHKLVNSGKTIVDSIQNTKTHYEYTNKYSELIELCIDKIIKMTFDLDKVKEMTLFVPDCLPSVFTEDANEQFGAVKYELYNYVYTFAINRPNDLTVNTGRFVDGSRKCSSISLKEYVEKIFDYYKDAVKC